MTFKQEQVLALARKQGIIRAADISSIGATRSHLRSLVGAGHLTRVERGLYRLNEFDFTESHSLVEAVRRQSRGVICLLSALSFHNIGTQQPHQVWLTVPYGSRIAKSGGVSQKIIVATSPGYESGIETHIIEGVEVPVYSIAKSVADCFKFRNKIGIDVAIEALREVMRDRRCSIADIYTFAKIDRVVKVIRPYMEALA